MENLLSVAEKLIAIAGILICVVAGVMRLTGHYQVLGVESLTIFIAGMAAMLVAILIKVHMR